MAFEANLSRWRVALLLLGAIAFVVLGCWLVGLFGPPPSSDWMALGAGLAAIVFFGGCAIVAGLRLFQSGVELRIDHAGIYWRRWSDLTIPWSAIERIAVMEMKRQRFACLFLRDPRAFPSTGLAGKLAGANKAMGFGDISLSVTGTDQSFDAMMAATDRFAPAGRRG